MFTEEDSNRIGPIFTQTEIPADPERNFKTLREYYTQYKQKKKQQQQSNEEKKSKQGTTAV